MIQPAIAILPPSEVSSALRRQMDELDHLAFDADKEDPLLAGIEWTPNQDWHVLGLAGSELVTQLGLLRREIRVGEEKIRVAGVGGVATHPRWQKQGLASALMRATQEFMREKMSVLFGLLVCSEVTRPMYESLGWWQAAEDLYYLQNGERRLLKASVMILPLAGRNWPSGTIDLCGLPW